MKRDMAFSKDHSIHSMSPSRREDFDTESLYSFDSVSTNGRLLDRLDMAAEEYEDDDDYLRRRESYMLMQSTGRLLDRLGLDDDGDEDQFTLTAQPPLSDRYRPIRANLLISLERMRLSGSSASVARHPLRTLSSKSRIPVQSAPYKAIQKGNFSVDSLKADISHSTASIYQDVPPLPHLPMSIDSLQTPLQRANSSTLLVQSERKVEDGDSTPPVFTSPIVHSRTNTNGIRNLSNSSNTSATSLDSFLFNPNLKFDPSLESLTKQAMQLRALGNHHREASYKLQSAANIPNNYPKAMQLYALALSSGLGVKVNEALAVKWLCRSIMVSYILETAPIDTASMNNYVTKLNELSPEEAVGMVKKNISLEEIDPLDSFDHFLSIPAASLAKIINGKDNNTVGAAYHQLGRALILGSGHAKDEILGRKFLAKAASLGYAESMAQLGSLWTTKSKYHKKDLRAAAAWLRLAELFGMKDIGNSWIYKEKYTGKAKKK